jgi:hypothetical protein
MVYVCLFGVHFTCKVEHLAEQHRPQHHCIVLKTASWDNALVHDSFILPFGMGLRNLSVALPALERFRSFASSTDGAILMQPTWLILMQPTWLILYRLRGDDC